MRAKSGGRFIVLLTFCIHLVACPVGLFAQEETDNNPAEKEYEAQKINVELVGQPPPAPGTGIVDYTVWKRWKVTWGANSMTEPEFFRFLGREEDARKVESYQETTGAMKIAGYFLGTVGAGFFLTGLFANYIYHSNSDEVSLNQPDYPAMLLGTAIGAGGVTLVYMGRKRSREHWASYGTASDIADEYNRTLMIRLQKEF